MSALIQHIALVSQTSQIPFAQTALIGAALQKQVVRDFAPIWNVQSTLDTFARIEDVPSGYWPILIRDDIGTPGAAGVHLDKDGQPYALVQASEGTPLTCSHEMLEMLADPFGNRMVAGDSIKRGQGRVRYLVEICDPCEAEGDGYTVNGIRLSDFYTPSYFDPIKADGVRYSYTGSLSRPRQVLKGGYLSWIDTKGKWWQATYFGARLQYDGPYDWQRKESQSCREMVDAHTRRAIRNMQGRALKPMSPKAASAFASASSASPTSGWAKSLMEQVECRIAAGC